MEFEWDEKKEQTNIRKHGVDFADACSAFSDSNRIVMGDFKHSQKESRYFCYGKVGKRVLTVRFTMRGENVRIIGAGYWREGKDIYEAPSSKI